METKEAFQNPDSGYLNSIGNPYETGDLHFQGNSHEKKQNMEEFEPFELVIVRKDAFCYWMPALYGKYVNGKHLTSAGWQNECKRYWGNEHLLGTCDYNNNEE